jgi:hypothetical protein
VTRDAVIDELREVEKDLFAFRASRDVVQARLREMEGWPERHAMMSDWPAFIVVDNSLIMAIVRCEGLLEDYQKLLDQEELPNNVLTMERRP